jgi:predicted amino acid dehydrogenase
MNSLATRADVDGLRVSVETLARETNNYRREVKEYVERWHIEVANHERAMRRRTQLEIAAVGATATVLVVILQVFSSHSYARAMIHVDARVQRSRADELAQLKAHDELVIRAAIDEYHARMGGLTVKGKQP